MAKASAFFQVLILKILLSWKWRELVQKYVIGLRLLNVLIFAIAKVIFRYVKLHILVFIANNHKAAPADLPPIAQHSQSSCSCLVFHVLG